MQGMDPSPPPRSPKVRRRTDAMALIIIATMAFALVTGAMVRLAFIVGDRLGLFTVLTFIGGGAYLAAQGGADALFGLALAAATMGTLGERVVFYIHQLKVWVDKQ